MKGAIMKKRLFLCTIIAICLVLSISVYTHFSPAPTSTQCTTSKESTATKENPASKETSTDKGSTDYKTLVSVDIYSKSDSKHVITLKPKSDSTLISQYSKLLENQSPAKCEDGSDYEVVASFSDGSKSYYGIDAQQTELAALCDNTLGLTFANPM